MNSYATVETSRFKYPKIFVVVLCRIDHIRGVSDRLFMRHLKLSENKVNLRYRSLNVLFN